MKKMLGLVALLGVLGTPPSSAQTPEREVKPSRFTGEALQTVRSYFSGATEEKVLCLTGVEEHDAYVVRRGYPASTLHASTTKFSGHCAPNKYRIGLLHNHPESKQCMFSDTDLADFYMKRKANVYGVVCAANSDSTRMRVLTKPTDWYNESRDLEAITDTTVTF